MKRLLILFSLFFVFSCSFGQGVIVRTNGVATVSDGRLIIPYNFFMPRYLDTVQANNNLGIDTCGAIIFTYTGNAVWSRSCSPKRWERIGTGGSSGNPDTIYTALPLYVDTVSDPPKRILKILHADGIVTPGIVTWSGGGLTFDVTSALYYIGYKQFTSPSAAITLNPSDPTNPRIDKIGVDTTANVIKITGTAASNPIAPQTNPSSQLPLTDIYLNANDTVPSQIKIETIYNENLGSPTEWNANHTGTMSVDYNNTDNPYIGTKAAFVATYVTGSALTFTKGSGNDTVKAGEILKFYLYLNGALANNFQFQFFNGLQPVSNSISVNSAWGLNPLDSNNYQNISIPLNAFNFTRTIFNKVVITMSGSDISGAKGYYIDYLQFQTGIINPDYDLSNKVDSVTKSNDSLFYWVKGLSTFIGTTGGSGGSQTLQQVFDVQSANALLNKNDTISVASNTLHIRGVSGGLNVLMNNSPTSTSIFSTDTQTGMSMQDNTGGTTVSSMNTSSNLARIRTSQGSAVTDLRVTKDNLAVNNNSGTVFQINQADGGIIASQYGVGNFLFGDETYGIGVDATGNVIEIPLSSGGATNSNIGSGYRLAVPNTNNIKTLFNKYGTILDSTNNTNGISFTVDSSLLLTKLRATSLYQPLGALTSIFNIGSGFRLVKPTDTVKTLINGYAVGIDSSSNTNALTFKVDTSLIPTKLFVANTYLTPANIAPLYPQPPRGFVQIGNDTTVWDNSVERSTVRLSDKDTAGSSNYQFTGVDIVRTINKVSGVDGNVALWGLAAEPTIGALNTKNWTNLYGMVGVRASSNIKFGAGGILNFNASLFATADLGAMTIVDRHGLYVQNPVQSGTSSVTNNYGVFIESMTAGSGVNYNIYSNGTGLNYFGGAARFNSTPTFSTMTPRSILWAGTAGVLRQDNTNLYWDSSALRVKTTGLDVTRSQDASTTIQVLNASTGTSAGEYLLLGEATSGAKYTALEYFNNSYTASGLYQPNVGMLELPSSGGGTIVASGAAGILKFGTGGADVTNERMRIIAGGNIGMGITAPTATLHLKAATSTAGTGQLKFATSSLPTTPEIGLMNMSNGLWFLDSSNSVRDTIATRGWARSNITGGSGTTYTFSTGLTNTASTITNNLSTGVSGGQSMNGGTAANDDLTINGTTSGTKTTSYVNMQTTGGNVGIGTTAPSAKLHINSAVADMWLTSDATADNYSTMLFGQAPITGGSYAEFIRYTNASAAGNLPGDFVIDNVGKRIILSTLYSSGYRQDFVVASTGNIGLGQSTPTGVLHIKAGTATASTAPLKFTTASSVVLTTPETGVMEVDTSKIYYSSGIGANLKRNEIIKGTYGQSALTGGTVTVSTTAVKSTSIILLTDATTGSLTNVGSPTVGTITAGTSFVINSTNILDASNVNWLIINP